MSNLSEEEIDDILEEIDETWGLAGKKAIVNLIDKHEKLIYENISLQEELDRLQKENKELNLENQALYESINCNDDNMLARRYLEEKEKNEKNDRQLQIDTAEEVVKWKGKYHLLSRKINGVLEDKIKDKIKELKKDMVKNGAIIDILYEILEGE